MTSALGRPNPYVSLLYSDIHPSALKQVDQRFLGTPTEQIEAALSTYRVLVINRVKHDMLKQKEITGGSLVRMVDVAAEVYMRKFTSMIGPAAIQAYVRAYRNADAGDIPMSTLYALAEQHSARMGTYFHETSKEALTQGFNQYVNRRVVSKAAADRVLDAYGLTPRQMNAYVALAAPQKVTTATPRPLKAQAREFIGRAVGKRFKFFAEQEVHNLDQQAQQTAWAWLQDKGKITGEAYKVWLTARDERTCPQCAPMHGKKVLVTERFELPGGIELYVPGVHPNCRCEARVVDPGRMQIEYGDPEEFGKADWDSKEHPRGGNPSNRGQFSRISAARRARQTEPEVWPRVQEKERDRPVIQPAAVIEEEPVEEKVVLRRPAIKLGREQTVRLGENVRIAPQETVTLTPVASEEKVKLTKPVVRIAPEHQIKIEQQTSPVVLRRVMRPTEIQEKPAPAPKPPAFELVDKLPEPVYQVLEPGDVKMSGSYQFASDKFKTSEMGAVYDASTFRQHLVRAKVNELTSDHDLEYVSVRVFDPIDGVYHAGRIKSGDVESIVKGMVQYEDGDDAVKDQHVPLEMWDLDGNIWLKTIPMPFMEVAEALEVHPGDFKVIVLEATHAHSTQSKRGSWDHDSGTKAGEEAYFLSGEFTTSEERDARFSGHDHGVTIVTVAPFDPGMSSG